MLQSLVVATLIAVGQCRFGRGHLTLSALKEIEKAPRMIKQGKATGECHEEFSAITNEDACKAAVSASKFEYKKFSIGPGESKCYKSKSEVYFGNYVTDGRRPLCLKIGGKKNEDDCSGHLECASQFCDPEKEKCGPTDVYESPYRVGESNTQNCPHDGFSAITNQDACKAAASHMEELEYKNFEFDPLESNQCYRSTQYVYFGSMIIDGRKPICSNIGGKENEAGCSGHLECASQFCDLTKKKCGPIPDCEEKDAAAPNEKDAVARSGGCKCVPTDKNLKAETCPEGSVCTQGSEDQAKLCGVKFGESAAELNCLYRMGDWGACEQHNGFGPGKCYRNRTVKAVKKIKRGTSACYPAGDDVYVPGLTKEACECPDRAPIGAACSKPTQCETELCHNRDDKCVIGVTHNDTPGCVYQAGPWGKSMKNIYINYPSDWTCFHKRKIEFSVQTGSTDCKLDENADFLGFSVDECHKKENNEKCTEHFECRSELCDTTPNDQKCIEKQENNGKCTKHIECISGLCDTTTNDTKCIKGKTETHDKCIYQLTEWGDCEKGKYEEGTSYYGDGKCERQRKLLKVSLHESVGPKELVRCHTPEKSYRQNLLTLEKCDCPRPGSQN